MQSISIEKLRLLSGWVLVKIEDAVKTKAGIEVIETSKSSENNRDSARSGVVVLIGQDVDDFHIGQKVWFDKYGAMTEAFNVEGWGFCRIMKDEDIIMTEDDNGGDGECASTGTAETASTNSSAVVSG